MPFVASREEYRGTQYSSFIHALLTFFGSEGSTILGSPVV